MVWIRKDGVRQCIVVRCIVIRYIGCTSEDRYVGLQPCWPSCRGVNPLRRVRTGAMRLRNSARPFPTATSLLRVGTVHRLHLRCRARSIAATVVRLQTTCGQRLFTVPSLDRAQWENQLSLSDNVGSMRAESLI